jgi:hypothetical protein
MHAHFPPFACVELVERLRGRRKRNADPFRRQLRGPAPPFGYDTVVVDGGWNGAKFPNGSRVNLFNGNGLPIPDATRFPSSATSRSLKGLAAAMHAQGLKFGAWFIRGVPVGGVAQRLPIAGAPGLTLADAATYSLNCSWDSDVLGTNAPSAAAAAWYASLARWYVAQDLDLIKIDCMWPSANHTPFDGDVLSFAQAFSALAPGVTISWSPGDGTTVGNGSWLAAHGPHFGVAYRVTPDFHDTNGWPRLIQQYETAVEFAPLIGANGTFPDLDMLPFGLQAPNSHSCAYSHDEQRFIMTLWAVARSPLILGAALPLAADDAWTLPLVTNAAVLAVNAASCGNVPVPVLNEDPSGLGAWAALAEGDGETSYWALFNMRDAAANVSVALQPPPAGGRLCAKDLWTGKEEGGVARSLTRELPAHAGGLWAVGPC